MGDRAYVEQNAAQTERLHLLVSRLTPKDLDASVGHGWTVRASLAHLAFWDRRTFKILDGYERNGVNMVRIDPNPINDEMLAEWLAVPDDQVLREVVEAAEAADAKVASLSPEIVEVVMQQRPRTVIRGLHRKDHLDEIEQALRSA